jgi:ATP-dependent helicase HrpB
MQPLPIDPHLDRIVSSLRESGAIVLVAPPGAGKTTRVPPALLHASPPRSGAIVVLQPRRIAAQAAAARMAEERGWSLGAEVGYQVRFERKLTRSTRIQVLTEGVFLRRLEAAPGLDGVAAVLFDEFHERSLEADLALAMVKELRESLRPDLAVLVMSATLAAEPVAAFLGGCPVVAIEDRRFPIEVEHRYRPRDVPLHEAVLQSLRDRWPQCRGHTLVFLPGMAEIRRSSRAVEGFAGSSGASVLPLHGRLTLREQEDAIRPSRERKIILATNVAETSLTIDGVDLVIDSGLVRILQSDGRLGLDRLVTVRASRHAVEQRAGRAGRVGPGRAVRLWSVEEHARLRESEEPEVRRVDLAGAVLELRAWGVREPETFGWLERPEPWALERAEALLVELGALSDPRGGLTSVGKRMLGLGIHPRLGRLVLAAAASGCAREGAALAAVLEEGDFLRRGFAEAPAGRRGAEESGPSDLLLRLEIMEEYEESRRSSVAGGPGGASRDFDAAALRSVVRLRDEVHRVWVREERRSTRGRGGPGEVSGTGAGAASPAERDRALLRALLVAFPDRVVRRRTADGGRGLMVGGKGVVQAPESVVRDGELFVAVEIDEGARSGRGEAVVRLASRVERSWIEDAFPERLREASETFFDAAAEKVRSRAAQAYRDLPLEDWREKRPEPRLAAELLAAAARECAEELFHAHEAAREWLLRLRFLRHAAPEMALAPCGPSELGELIAAACEGKSSFAELRRLDLAALLRGGLGHEVVRAVEGLAPEALLVPSGRCIRLRYSESQAPVLAVRVQELFGLKTTPRVAGGRVPVVLHILGPNFRPVQVTQDLESFWRSTYFQVRKDLRARYPKHSWPEDPLQAQPERGPRRRK